MNKNELMDALSSHLGNVFAGDSLSCVLTGMDALADSYRKRIKAEIDSPDYSSVYLITYGDSFFDSRTSEPGLATLKRFYDAYLATMVSDVHILPMFPYTSDDGFSVTDYLKVREDLGTWADVDRLGASTRLMFDFVANHISKSSDWFQKYLSGDERYANSFIEYNDAFDYANVTRPRTSPLFHTYEGGKKVWTTFSEDQIDINYRDPATFVRMTSVLCEYLAHGATSIRLDAIGFMWKESGTTCMSLPQVHEVIKAWHALVEYLAPGAQIITETNVPHEENVSYFGDGADEANMVYQFALPPLALHSFITGDASALATWARQIEAPSKTSTFFNFLSSHDGIGMRPVEGILNDAEKQALVNRALEVGGRVSMKSNPDGSESVYELNVNYLSALRAEGEDENLWLAKVRAAFALLCSMVGVPAFYFHMLVGSGNDVEAVERTGIARRINRARLDLACLENELAEDASIRARVYNIARDLIEARRREAAFDPYGSQEVLDAGDDRVFMVRRLSGRRELVCAINVSADSLTLTGFHGVDILSGQQVEDTVDLTPYGVLWIRPNE